MKEVNKQKTIDPGNISMLIMGEWYRDKWLKIADKETGTAIVKPIYDNIGADFEVSKQAWLGCAARAVVDPAFEAYARETVTKMKSEDWWKGLER